MLTADDAGRIRAVSKFSAEFTDAWTEVVNCFKVPAVSPRFSWLVSVRIHAASRAELKARSFLQTLWIELISITTTCLSLLPKARHLSFRVNVGYYPWKQGIGAVRSVHSCISNRVFNTRGDEFKLQRGFSSARACAPKGSLRRCAPQIQQLHNIQSRPHPETRLVCACPYMLEGDRDQSREAAVARFFKHFRRFPASNNSLISSRGNCLYMYL